MIFRLGFASLDINEEPKIDYTLEYSNDLSGHMQMFKLIKSQIKFNGAEPLHLFTHR